MPRRDTFIVLIVAWLSVCSPVSGIAVAQNPGDERSDALAAIPYERLTSAAAREIREIADRPTLFRRLPTQAIDCDPKMFVFLVRHPEVLVGIWDRMEVSTLQTQRVGPYQLTADDRAGTQCTIDLVYGDAKTHVYVGRGVYTGTMAPRPITGSGVFVLRSNYSGDGDKAVTGTLDCFIQMDNLGADLIARTLSSVIGKTADHNFTETARFMSQVSAASERNPSGMRDLALELPQVDTTVRQGFAETIIDLARRADYQIGRSMSQPVPFVSTRRSE
jgi:hypothetical protein